MGQAIRILGIDPGLRRTGWGLIGCEGNRLIYVACGSVETNERLSLAERLVTIHDGLARVVDEFRPDEAAVEQTFVNRDPIATLKLGQSAASRCWSRRRPATPRLEYAPEPREEDHRRCGPRREGAIPAMVNVLLPQAEPESADAADALAIAVTHAQQRPIAVLKAKAKAR